MKFSSFKYAIQGIILGIKKESNFRTMLICFLLVLLANVIFKVTPTEWIITLLCSGIVLSLELVNSAIEKTIDFVTDEIHALAGAVKDYSAGASLVMSIVSFVVAVIIYLPYFFNLVFN